GDNSAILPPPTAETAALSAGQRRQLGFREFLFRELSLPTVVLPGDNWPWGFEEVFGPSTYSFDVAGLHLICLSPDLAAKGVEGCAAFSEGLWAWLAEDLERNAGRPTLVCTHLNLIPPAFLESGRLEALLRAHPQVLATCTGHMHLDLEFRRGDLVHLVCPALGVGVPPAFKVVRVFRDRIVLNTVEVLAGGRELRPTLRWQKVPIPAAFRDGMEPVRMDLFPRENRRERPPIPLREDPTLLDRQGELLLPMMSFLLEYVRGALNGSPAAQEAP
ncbi:MAG: hypothetical protein JXR77_07185, partial [Lentisphaeria bacterium]|nr:hypothetical protein [Lentisphaeria bacterium]